MLDLVIEISIIAFLILINGVLAMSEMAVISARKARLLQHAENGDHGAKRALDLANDSTRFLSTVQIGITLIGILAGAVGGATFSSELTKVFRQVPLPFIAYYAQDIAIGLIVLVITYFSLVLGELVPKRLAQINPEKTAAIIARPIGMLATLARPIVALLSSSTDLVLRLLGVKIHEEDLVTPEEITVLMEQGEQVGMFEEVETDIVESVFRLSDLRAGALMTPRTEIDWLDIKDPFPVTLRYLIDSSHSHFPVCDTDLDNIQGILRSKDLLARMADGIEPNLLDLARPTQFIPESLPVYEVLEVLRSSTGNLALVIDEYGGVLGIITLFDVMQALVGGISERGEPFEPEAVQREDGSWLIEGMMRIDEFKDLLHLDILPEEGHAGYQTVGGFMMTVMGSVPQAGEFFESDGWRFEVVDMDGLRVDKILARKV
ncbi:MAG: HlyC/CorC family transporter [Anaerolineaceae bacterium]|nr:HlyC/CorC family transporter [Anaerolineaceae bacterium]